MNMTKISNAQLNVSNFYTVENVTNLINRLSSEDYSAYFNLETRSIDIEAENDSISDFVIKHELEQWLRELPADNESIDIICENIDVVFNITKLSNNLTKLYLY